MTTAQGNKEAVGERYELQSMRHAQQMTWQAIEQIAAAITPGMRESDAQVLGKRILGELGMDRIWHPLLIRFGANTLKTFQAAFRGRPGTGA